MPSGHVFAPKTLSQRRTTVTEAVKCFGYIETGGKAPNLRQPASRHDAGREVFGAWTAKEPTRTAALN
jgi:hypothetical protein